MMIDHLALYVYDLEKAKVFYVQYFGATSNQKYHNPKTGLETYFLSFEDGSRLEIMTRPGICKTDAEVQYRAGYVHIAFSVGSIEAVDNLTARLKNDGISVVSGPRTTGDGYYESCVSDPEGNLIEIVG